MYYSSYLIHFCARKYKHNSTRADKVLEDILSSGCFKPSKWRVFDENSASVVLSPAPKSEQDNEAEERQQARLALLREIGLDNAGANQYQNEAYNRLIQLRFQMVCFTDLPFPALADHITTFGSYAIALKKEAGPALQCHPVHYVKADAPSMQFARLASEIRDIMIELLRSLKIENANMSVDDVFLPLYQVQESLEHRRLGFLQDIQHLNQHEWRFIPNEKNKNLHFKPEDVAFILVDTWERAVQWNRLLSSSNKPKLNIYSNAGILVLPMALLQEGRVFTSKR